MAGVDWGLQGQGFNALQTLQAFGQAQQQGLQRQQMALQVQERERQAQERQMQAMARQQAAQQLGQGDSQGAARTFAASGEFDGARFAQSVTEVGHKQAAQQIDELGQLALLADNPQKWDSYTTQYAKQHPDAAQYIGQYSPELRATIIAQAGKAREYLDQQQVHWQATPQGGYLDPFNAQGQPLDPRTLGGPATSAPQSGGGVPSAAVQHLQQNPSLAAAFDAKYGSGSSARYLGGAPSQGGATFP